MIWVLKKKRKQGVARGLAEALAAHCEIKVEEFAHMIPFTEGAVRLWMAVNLSTIYFV